MSQDDFAFEVAPGLPAPLPDGEKLLWQGRPNTWRLAVESLSLRWVLGYFLLLAVWRVAASLTELSFGAALATGLPPLVLGLIAGGLLLGFSWAQARATVYTVTSARVILRIGAALQVTMQIPFSKMQNIALDLRPGGTGTLAFETDPNGGAGLSYLALWPHVRPWHLKHPHPAFRAIPGAQAVAQIVAEAAESQIAQPKIVRAPAAAPAAAEPIQPAGPQTMPAE